MDTLNIKKERKQRTVRLTVHTPICYNKAKQPTDT